MRHTLIIVFENISSDPTSMRFSMCTDKCTNGVRFATHIDWIKR